MVTESHGKKIITIIIKYYSFLKLFLKFSFKLIDTYCACRF